MISEHITVSALRERGWTTSLIRDHLGDADRLHPNPHYSNAAPCRLYDLSRVEGVEQSEAWQAERERTHKRQASAQAAAKTKRANLLSEIKQLVIAVPRLELDTLMRRACEHYNERQHERGNWHYEAATLKSDPAFLERITVNYLRHVLSTYDDDLAQTHGRVGVREAYQAIRSNVYSAIASAYPALAAECNRQLAAKVLA